MSGKIINNSKPKKKLNHCRSSAISKVSMSAQARVLVCSKYFEVFGTTNLTRTQPTLAICISWQFLASLRAPTECNKTIESFECVSSVVANLYNYWLRQRVEWQVNFYLSFPTNSLRNIIMCAAIKQTQCVRVGVCAAYWLNICICEAVNVCFGSLPIRIMWTEHELAWNLCKCKLVRVAEVDTLDRLRWQYLMRFIYASNVLLCTWNSCVSDFGLRTGSAEARCMLCKWQNTFPYSRAVCLAQHTDKHTDYVDAVPRLRDTYRRRRRCNTEPYSIPSPPST